MRIFFDTEFIDNGRTIDLISIGMVREDGSKLYCESEECDLTKASPWVQRHVIPHLVGNGMSRARIAEDVQWFVGSRPEFWGFYADYDWVALCQLYGPMMEIPDNWPRFCLDLQQEAYLWGESLPGRKDGREHNALADALWTFATWKRLAIAKNHNT
jgi:hypothetical protein